VKALPALLALLLAGAAGCGGEESEQAEGVRSGSTTQSTQRCDTGVHAFRLRNGQAARMRVTPDGQGAKALAIVLHGAGQSPQDALRAFQGGWGEPGLVFLAFASKGETWAIMTSHNDRDLESVDLALAEAAQRCRIDPKRIAVGGFSDGASYALTLGVADGKVFRAIMALSPGGVANRPKVGVPRIFVAHGTLDPVFPIALAGDAVVRKLRGAGYPVTYRRFRGGHEASTATSAAAIRWFLAG
jgi:phospholipase/carboxylesterase